MDGISWYITLLLWLVRIVKKRKLGKKIYLKIRDRVLWGLVSEMSEKAFQEIKIFARRAINNGLKGMDLDDLSKLANAIRDVIAQLIDMESKQLYCTIKLVDKSSTRDRRKGHVITLARSMPQNRRRITTPYLTGENSVFACLIGCDDGQNHWNETVYQAFICNDLTKHSNFVCSRKNWQKHFKSTAVFPLKYLDPKTMDYLVLGYITFDAMRTGAFGNVPDIFSYNVDTRDEYHAVLSQTPLAHLGNLLADALTSVLICIFETAKKGTVKG